ncbi:hypothetical protein MVI27_08490 [Chryseobacterium salipaludis]|uniref:hypothetical protein n=1 Tax=Chryseobacterium TaxID=59732 RepID=UPI001FF47B65|nr:MULTISPECIES: hypothetical protein [Chryseobacterium]MCJ8498298.1 hypothetical protein [Chryseobacterium salipaludis]MCX3297456.1 hypothetical protein [Planobacterium sp. JC490]
MKNEEILLTTLPSNNSKSIAFSVAVLLVIIFSYFVPGWNYLIEVKSYVIQQLSLIMVFLLLLSFYFLLFILFYQIICELFSKNAVLKISQDQIITLFIEGIGDFTINKDQLCIEKNVIKIRGEKQIDLKVKNRNRAALQNLLMRKKKSIQNAARTSFLGGFRALSEVYIYFIFLIIIYTLTAIYSFKFITPYIADLQILFRAKGALLMIISALPFILIFVVAAYFFTNRMFFSKRQINFNFLKTNLTLWTGKKILDFNKNEINKTVFFKNSTNDVIKWIVIYSKTKRNYLIYSKGIDMGFQDFANDYKIFFDIKDKDAIRSFSSPKSVLYKETFYHE